MTPFHAICSKCGTAGIFPHEPPEDFTCNMWYQIFENRAICGGEILSLDSWEGQQILQKFRARRGSVGLN